MPVELFEGLYLLDAREPQQPFDLVLSLILPFRFEEFKDHPALVSVYLAGRGLEFQGFEQGFEFILIHRRIPPASWPGK